MELKEKIWNVLKDQIHPTWEQIIKKELEQEYFQKIFLYILSRKDEGIEIYPSSFNIFRVFNESIDNIKCVILGQDPYHTPNMAMGLAFSVPQKTVYEKLPPSLMNIFEEIESDCYDGFMLDRNPDLSRWSKQGVFLLNTCLTVEKGIPLSHSNIGWEKFTEVIFQALADRNVPQVFMLWGNHAKAYKRFIHNDYHLVLEARHPSPFSARSGFFGCKHFSKTNEYLKTNKIEPIIW